VKFDPTDEELMNRFCQGDTAALDALFERHSSGVHAFLSRLVRDGALAEDLLQTTFLSVIRSRDRYRRGSPVLPWLLTIAGNAARDSLRRTRLQVEVLAGDDPPPEPSAEQTHGDPAARKRIEAAFQALPELHREAVLMHKVHGLSFEEIGQALGITATAARLRAHRGYERLRTLLEGL
jgi:RNA polymerase sigma-70 factor (ECF subfamily)